MPLVISTMTNGHTYAEYHNNDANQLSEIKRSVSIKGGANLPTKRTLVTPRGMGTIVTEDELSFLQALPEFQKHLAGGYVKVVKSNNADADMISKDMTAKDDSAPLTNDDFVNAPKVGDQEMADVSTIALRKTKASKRKG